MNTITLQETAYLLCKYKEMAYKMHKLEHYCDTIYDPCTSRFECKRSNRKTDTSDKITNKEEIQKEYSELWRKLYRFESTLKYLNTYTYIAPSSGRVRKYLIQEEVKALMAYVMHGKRVKSRLVVERLQQGINHLLKNAFFSWELELVEEVRSILKDNVVL